MRQVVLRRRDRVDEQGTCQCGESQQRQSGRVVPGGAVERAHHQRWEELTQTTGGTHDAGGGTDLVGGSGVGHRLPGRPGPLPSTGLVGCVGRRL